MAARRLRHVARQRPADVEHHAVAHTDGEEPVVPGFEIAEALLQQHDGAGAHGRHGDDVEGVRRPNGQAEQLPVVF